MLQMIKQLIYLKLVQGQLLQTEAIGRVACESDSNFTKCVS